MKILCQCGGELSFSTDRQYGRSIQICTKCGECPLRIVRPEPIKKSHGGQYRVLSNEEWLSLLIQLAARIGRTPTQESFARQPLPSYSAYCNRFGSWTEAVRLAGLTPNKRGNFKRDAA